jgi:hypothetical protein
MKVLGIDPGTSESGIVIFDCEGEIGSPLMHGKIENHKVINLFRRYRSKFDIVVFEMPVAYSGSNDLRDTIIWVGRMIQVLEELKIPYDTSLCRSSVTGWLLKKKKIAGNVEVLAVKSKDSRIRRLMRQMFGNAVKGFAKDAWQALGLVVTWKQKRETANDKKR